MRHSTTLPRSLSRPPVSCIFPECEEVEEIEFSMRGDASPLEYLFLMCTVHLGEFFLGPTRELGNSIVNLAIERHIQRDCYVTQGKFEQRAGDNIWYS